MMNNANVGIGAVFVRVLKLKVMITMPILGDHDSFHSQDFP